MSLRHGGTNQVVMDVTMLAKLLVCGQHKGNDVESCYNGSNDEDVTCVMVVSNPRHMKWLIWKVKPSGLSANDIRSIDG